MGRAHDRAVVAVTQREGVGQGVVIRQVGAGVVAHGQGALGRALVLQFGVDPDEGVHPSLVAALVLGPPIVGEVEGAVGHVGGHRVEVEGQESSRR